jgi:hypothetical protein
MSGAYGWKLVENYGQHIAKLVAIAPGPPGNIQAVSEIASETADTVVVHGSTTMTINLKQAVVSDRNFVEVKLVGKSTQFPREHIGLYASSLVPIPPRLLYQRRNVRGSQLKVADLTNYRGKRILVMTGTADIDHPRELDGAIVEWLNQNGAKADFLYLGDHGIDGNGHMMMIEKNSDVLATRSCPGSRRAESRSIPHTRILAIYACSLPLVPAKAGTQPLALDSAFAGMNGVAVGWAKSRNVVANARARFCPRVDTHPTRETRMSLRSSGL